MSRGFDGEGAAGIELTAHDRPGNQAGAVGLVYHVRAGADGAADYIICESLPFDVRVIHAWNVVTTAGGGTTVQVLAGANAITDAMAAAVLDTHTGAATIDDTFATVAQGCVLSATTAGGAGVTDVFVLCLRVE